MKLTAQLLLIIFLAFLSMPTIVSVIEKKTNTSYFYSMSEEEQNHKEIKVEFNFEPAIALWVLPFRTSSLIPSENVLKHDSIAASIFIPPPEQA